MPKHHLIISGTGRAGTSFMVRYLHECGIDTHLSRTKDPHLDEYAHAGLEDYPLPKSLGNLPYVIKSPWISYDPDLALSHEDIVVDAVIIPIRSLDAAASSRVILETGSMHRRAPWMKTLKRSWNTWANVPGGMLVPLNVEDQKRILAVGFHELVHYCVRNEIPIVFLDFPRLVEDANYLYQSISKVVDLDRDTAIAAHRKIADVSLVRTGDEIDPHSSAAIDTDRAALQRALSQAQADHSQLQRKYSQTQADHSQLVELLTGLLEDTGQTERQQTTDRIAQILGKTSPDEAQKFLAALRPPQPQGLFQRWFKRHK